MNAAALAIETSGPVGAGGVLPFYDREGVTIYKGNALAVLMQLPSESVDCIITDPPYSSGGAFRGDRMGTTSAKYVQSGQVLQHGDFAGDNRDQRAYLQWCALWLSECLRITKPGGVCALFTDWRQLPITTDALQAGGWVWRGVGAWDKTEAARPMKGRYRNQCEYLVWGSRGGMTDEGPCLPGVWRVTVGGSEKHHIAGKPEKLMQMLVEICKPGGTVLDCFCGSGTTLKAAKESGRRAIGIEIADQWCDVSANRVAQGVLLGGGGAEPVRERVADITHQQPELATSGEVEHEPSAGSEGRLTQPRPTADSTPSNQ